MIDYKKFVENSRKWLKKYIQDNHLQSLIIGISGGIDSTVSCAIASPVCKELNIPLIGRSLPTESNRQNEVDAADLVGYAFCDDYKAIVLDKPYRTLANYIQLHEKCNTTNLQLGNIKARLRMIYLYNLASLYKGIVIDNDNFTEWNLGFFTLHGDTCDVNLGLHHLWKTEIYELADYLCTEYMESTIPIKHTKQSEAIKASMSLIPTDGNGVSNSDCEQFGLESYEQVDNVLKTMYYTTYFDENMDIDCESKDKERIRLIDSYNEQGVDKVMLLYQNTEYKRKPSPIMPTKEELGL